MKTCAVLFTMVAGIIPSPASAAVYKQINFEWEYDSNVPELAGYILYQNGQHLHTIHDPVMLSVDLSVGLTPGRAETFTMKAFDEDGNESAMSTPYRLEVPGTVEGNNFLPKPVAGISVLTGEAPLAIEFTADGSTDFDGTITSYFWEFGDGQTAGGTDVSYNYTKSGSFPVRLTITDDHGSQVVAEQVVTVMPGTQYVANPVAAFNVYPKDPSPQQAVWFSGLPSSVPDGDINRFYWDFGDGSNATGAITNHRYRLPGTYKVILTVWDDQGISSQKSFSLTVA